MVLQKYFLVRPIEAIKIQAAFFVSVPQKIISGPALEHLAV
jgi:hypothetical protein